MTNFNAGAPRRAAATSPSSRIDAANRLVQETLARHGLAGNLATSTGVGSTPSALQAHLDRTLKAALSSASLANRTPAAMPDLQYGTTFQRYGFTCAAGSREYRLYVPSLDDAGASGLVMMLHGCTQTPEDFAVGTGMNALADRHGFIVAYPAQARGANAQSCWNWFSKGDQRRDRGEPAILAGLARQIMADHAIPADSTFVAGLSAGGAMAVILGEAYPDLFAAVGVQSGLPFGSASDVASAFAAMGGTPMRDDGRVRSGPRPRTIVFHGTADATVHPKNGSFIARDALTQSPEAQTQTAESGAVGGRRIQKEITRSLDGQAVVEHWLVEGLGHAWSGGRVEGSYTDPTGPDTSAEMIRFFISTPEGE